MRKSPQDPLFLFLASKISFVSLQKYLTSAFFLLLLSNWRFSRDWLLKYSGTYFFSSKLAETLDLIVFDESLCCPWVIIVSWPRVCSRCLPPGESFDIYIWDWLLFCLLECKESWRRKKKEGFKLEITNALPSLFNLETFFLSTTTGAGASTLTGVLSFSASTSKRFLE